MKLIAFRVTMYKGIIDSGWVQVNPLTALVGQNESGKTSLLRALHKFNPYKLDSDENNPDLHEENTDSYQIEWEWPRAHQHEQNQEQVVCSARFQLSNRDRSTLARIIRRSKMPDFVEVSRNYAGQLEVDWNENLLLDRLSPKEINDIIQDFPNVQDELSAPFKKVAYSCLKEVQHLVSERRFTELQELHQAHEQLMRTALSQLNSSQVIEREFVRLYLQRLEMLIQRLEQLSSMQSRVHEYVTSRLPTFIYMDDYRAFSGTAQLDDIQARRDGGYLTAEDRTFLAILSLSDLDLDKLVELGEGSMEESGIRQHNLNAGANNLTKIIENQFHQRNYVVDYRVDGQRFFTYIKDDLDSSPIEFQARSKGFQWFFSFELMFRYESKGTFKNCVILLDEPGLHLHPRAQRDLLRRLEHYARENTLLYTTHLPFMINLDNLDRIRVLEETDDGIVVTTNLTGNSPESKLVLQAALGMDISQNFFVAKRNLVVEGVDDYLVLTALSNLLQKAGEEGLPEDIRITPAGGASETVYITTFIIGQGLDVVALLDSDDAGRRAEEKLVKKWLTQYNPKSQAKVILLGDAVGANGDFALEDLFPDHFVADIVQEFYHAEFARAGVTDITLQGNDMLWKRIERFMAEKGITINKGPIAKRLGWKISSMKEASELPPETRDNAIRLFAKIRSAIHKGGPQSS